MYLHESKKSRIPLLARRLGHLDGLSVEYGIFADSGTHPTANMPKANLLAIHELRTDGDERPVLAISVKENQDTYGLKANQELVNFIHKIVAGRNPVDSKILEGIGKFAVKQTKDIFGDTSKLKPNKPSTVAKKGFNSPLIEFGELKQAISFKIKRKGEL